MLASLGCTPPGAGRPTGPLRVLERPAGLERARCLVVFLPGIGDSPEHFESHGFVGALRATGVDADVQLADMHFGYYRDRSLVPRLMEDVVLPARREGYEQLWLVGISLGGLGALALASATGVDRPTGVDQATESTGVDPDPTGVDRATESTGVDRRTVVDGLFLLAPFLGDDGVLDALREGRNPDEPFARIWGWLTSTRGADITLGFGEADRYARGHRRLAGLLPANRVLVGAGGHRWPVWEELWAAMLASGRLQRACGLRDSAASPDPGEEQQRR